MKDRKEKVVIVGAGMAGLTASAYLSKLDYDVCVIEKSSRCGGLVSTFENDGFSFDTGPRAFVNSGMVRPILNDLGLELEYVDNKISIGIEDEMLNISSLDSIQEYKKMLLNLFPDQPKEIDEIMKYIYKLSKYTEVLYEFDNPYFVDYTTDKKVFFKEFLPWTFRLLKVLRKFDKYNMPMEDFLNEITDNQSLKDIITQSFFKMTPTYFALGYFHVYLDYFYPKKGTGSLPKILEEMVQKQDTNIILNKEVSEIIPSKKQVIDTDGNIYEYDHLIWSADLKTFYKQLNKESLDKKAVKKINIQSHKVLASKAAESIFSMFIGVNKKPSYYKEKCGEHMFYSFSRKGLRDINQSQKSDLLNNFENKTKKEVFEWLENFCDFNTYEVSIPVLRDETLAPKNKTGIMISCLFDYDLVKKIDQKGWIQEFKTTMEDRIINNFSNTIFPGLKEDVLFKSSSTPLTINKLTGNSEGGIVGWSFESKAPVCNKLKDLSKSVFTPIPDVYKASQWAYAPAGVPIAMLTAWQATQKIIKKSKKNRRKHK